MEVRIVEGQMCKEGLVGRAGGLGLVEAVGMIEQLFQRCHFQAWETERSDWSNWE